MAERTAKSEGGIAETIKTVFWALLIAGVFRTLFFQPFWIPSGSMKDTLLIGDFLFVNKMAYGYSQYSCPFSMCPISGRVLDRAPVQGDVIVFRHPTLGVDYVKRLIGMPGDRVQMRAGRLWINGAALPTVPAGTFVEAFAPQGSAQNVPMCRNQPAGTGAPCEKPRLRETLPNGVVHDVLDAVEGGPLDDTPEFVVPAGHYFFMGDNRDNSVDSRVDARFGGVGMVPEEFLIGRADRIIFSSAGRSLLAFWTWRLDRFFEKVA